jgi:spore coat polysaccharide biosynthesis protein SpsF
MSSFETDQEAFWAGSFGDEYADRNKSLAMVAANTALFAEVLRRTRGINSVLELGANIGQNLRALRSLLPAARLGAVEINAKAVEHLRTIGDIDVHEGSLLDFVPETKWDLVLVKGVLIHIAPERLEQAYDVINGCAGRYVCLVEYYNPSPVEIEYRGHSERLFKRDFAGELMERVPGLELVDYGFVYRRDPVFALDDTTWFLLERVDD